MNPAESRIVAHVCADGWLSQYTEKEALQIVDGRRYHRDRERYEVGYSNNEQVLLQEFRDDINTVYDIERNIREGEIRLQSKRVFKRLKHLGAGSTYEWEVGNPIQSAAQPVKKSWLRAFFDDEATVSASSHRIRVKSMNETGLQDVVSLLEDIGIPSSLTGPNCDESWYLTISKRNVPEYYSLIGFRHPEKQERCKRSAKIA